MHTLARSALFSADNVAIMVALATLALMQIKPGSDVISTGQAIGRLAGGKASLSFSSRCGHTRRLYKRQVVMRQRSRKPVILAATMRFEATADVTAPFS